MTEMVRKHTVEGTGNWRTISEVVDRTKEMLHTAKSISNTFVILLFEYGWGGADNPQLPPPTLRDEVPIGSSSASMYPGYSPGDHEYGKAAETYGRFAAAARDQGIDITHPEAEYELGQAKGVKRKSLKEIRTTKKVAYGGPGTRGAGAAPGTRVAKPLTPYDTNTQSQGERGENPVNGAATNGNNPLFIIDVNPTPINIPSITNKSPKHSATSPEPHEQEQESSKRSATPPERDEHESKPKKAKKKHDGALPRASEDTNLSPKRNGTPPERDEHKIKPKKAKKKHDGVPPPGIKFEDISEEVNARLQEKEAKRKRKQEKKPEKKRKRDSGDLSAAQDQSGATADDLEVKTPPKKKKLATNDGQSVEKGISKKRHGADDEEGHGEGKKKKRRKSEEKAES